MTAILTDAELAEIAARWDGLLTFEEYDRDPRAYSVSIPIAGKDIRALLTSHAALFASCRFQESERLKAYEELSGVLGELDEHRQALAVAVEALRASRDMSRWMMRAKYADELDDVVDTALAAIEAALKGKHA